MKGAIMHFASTIVRPPYEAYSAFLQVTSGCTHDACRFCTYYKDVPFRVSPMNEIEKDVRELARYQDRFDRIFLQGADPFVLKTDRLLAIAELIHRYLPNVRTIAGYGRVDNVRNKTVEDLRKLKEAGYGGIVFGVETADDEVLSFMNKGYTKTDIIEQLSKLDEAGLTYAVIVMTGIAGHNNHNRHIKETVDVLNQLHPERVINSSLVVIPETPLGKDVREGRFVEATEKEATGEVEYMIRHLQGPLVFDSVNASNSTPVLGRIPEDRDELLKTVNGIFDEFGEDGLRRRRKNLKNF
jgi:radical SAM superfamily enzyme YgiQ (UPF0313 family)